MSINSKHPTLSLLFMSLEFIKPIQLFPAILLRFTPHQSLSRIHHSSFDTLDLLGFQHESPTCDSYSLLTLPSRPSESTTSYNERESIIIRDGSLGGTRCFDGCMMVE
jgi:hypothetical protein